MQPKNLHVLDMASNNMAHDAYNQRTMPMLSEAELREVYETTMNSPLLGQQMKIIYDILFHRGAMTSGELDEIIKKRNSSARLTELSRYGVVTATGRKTCPVTGRLAKLWVSTTETPALRNIKRIYYPTTHDLGSFNRDLTVMMAQFKKSNIRLSLEFKNVIAWLRSGAPCKHEPNVLLRQSRGSRRVKTDE